MFCQLHGGTAGVKGHGYEEPLDVGPVEIRIGLELSHHVVAAGRDRALAVEQVLESFPTLFRNRVEFLGRSDLPFQPHLGGYAALFDDVLTHVGALGDHVDVGCVQDVAASDPGPFEHQGCLDRAGRDDDFFASLVIVGLVAIAGTNTDYPFAFEQQVSGARTCLDRQVGALAYGSDKGTVGAGAQSVLDRRRSEAHALGVVGVYVVDTVPPMSLR